MARLSTSAVLLLSAAALLAACGSATGQGADNAAGVPITATEPPIAPEAMAPFPSISQTGGAAPPVDTNGPGSVYNNRTVGVQRVVQDGGCLILSVTAATGVCLADSTFMVNNVSIARPADYRADGLDATGYTTANFQANNTACAAQSAGVQQIFESEGCALRDALAEAGQDTAAIESSFVCMTSGVDTTNYDRSYPAAVCEAAAAAAAASLAAGNSTGTSGNPCSAARTTVIITNPCMGQDVVINATERFFLATDGLGPAPEPMMVPGPGPDVAPAPESAVPAPGPDALAPGPAADVPAPADGPAADTPATAPGPDSAAAPGPGSNTGSALTPSAAPTSGAYRTATAGGIAAAAAGVVACLAALA
mmetsp:Transcript_12994/g.39344  ORF Transcript_12994/g.39344 Transcript_12994/m.39344 type:complete len:366 (-) Transcript_12994:546-1643(-)|eukprot:CAMPEP_0206138498 /NCGR_PEP_ID=MMETSP1473-20131121/3364_1 /ASSEMBLY_ACC=CAM_ASM_001109 /TAXON_ID=1461547 /ORGANISM="Stichococcus sp, Strain RCC1054" /LENGTH=365 /DNA_ID=CAMNT_0053531951 /DNA_START=104 /DNA_END=1201 /DNA_ORIENTATION=-